MITIIKQGLRFIVISGMGWVIDFVIFAFLGHYISPVFANIISATTGVSFVFWISTRKTFKNRTNGASLKTKYFYYLLYQVLAILIASVVIGRINASLLDAHIAEVAKYSKIIAKILVTPFTMVANFVFMKILVEKV